MMYSVELRCDTENLAGLMSKMREWLDAQRFEPNTFRDTVDGESVTFLVQFKVESEAAASHKPSRVSYCELGFSLRRIRIATGTAELALECVGQLVFLEVDMNVDFAGFAGGLIEVHRNTVFVIEPCAHMLECVSQLHRIDPEVYFRHPWPSVGIFSASPHACATSFFRGRRL